jgi:hypothetical protein
VKDARGGDVRCERAGASPAVAACVKGLEVEAAVVCFHWLLHCTALMTPHHIDHVPPWQALIDSVSAPGALAQEHAVRSAAFFDHEVCLGSAAQQHCRGAGSLVCVCRRLLYLPHLKTVAVGVLRLRLLLSHDTGSRQRQRAGCWWPRHA